MSFYCKSRRKIADHDLCIVNFEYVHKYTQQMYGIKNNFSKK